MFVARESFSNGSFDEISPLPPSLTQPPVSSILNIRAVSRLHVRAVDRLDAVIEKTTLWIHLGRL